MSFDEQSLLHIRSNRCFDQFDSSIESMATSKSVECLIISNRMRDRCVCVASSIMCVAAAAADGDKVSSALIDMLCFDPAARDQFAYLSCSSSSSSESDQVTCAQHSMKHSSFSSLQHLDFD